MSYESTVLAKSPSLYVPFTELTGTPGTDVFADSTGNSHLGFLEITGPPASSAGGADGPITGEKAAVLDVSGEVDFESPSTIPTGDSLSYEMWVQLVNVWSTGNGRLFFDISAGGDSSIFEIVQDDSSHIGINITQKAANWSTVVPFSGLSCWHHYVVTFDVNDVKLYIDGTLKASITDPTFAISSFTPTFASIANEAISSTYPVNLNHLAIYDYTLTPTQVADNYAAATPRQDSSCFGPADIAILARVYRNQLVIHQNPVEVV